MSDTTVTAADFLPDTRVQWVNTFNAKVVHIGAVLTEDYALHAFGDLAAARDNRDAGLVPVRLEMSGEWADVPTLPVTTGPVEFVMPDLDQSIMWITPALLTVTAD